MLVLPRNRFEELTRAHPPVGVRIVSAIARLLSLKLRDTSDRYGSALEPGEGVGLT